MSRTHRRVLAIKTPTVGRKPDRTKYYPNNSLGLAQEQGVRRSQRSLQMDPGSSTAQLAAESTGTAAQILIILVAFFLSIIAQRSIAPWSSFFCSPAQYLRNTQEENTTSNSDLGYLIKLKGCTIMAISDCPTHCCKTKRIELCTIR